MSQPTLTIASGSGISDPHRRLASCSHAVSDAGLAREPGRGRPLGARQWVGLALNVGGLAVVLQSLAQHGVGA
jgi:hypothetical protein